MFIIGSCISIFATIGSIIGGSIATVTVGGEVAVATGTAIGALSGACIGTAVGISEMEKEKQRACN